MSKFTARVAFSCVFVDFFQDTSQISPATHELKIGLYTQTSTMYKRINFNVSRETRVTESSLNSTRHATQLSDYIRT